MIKKLPPVAFFLLLLFLIFNLSQSIWDLKKNEESLKNTKAEYEQAQKLNENLKEDLESKSKPEFAEKEAREKLGYVKEGEVAVVVEEKKKEVNPEEEKRKEFEKLPNPDKWFEMFFSN